MHVRDLLFEVVNRKGIVVDEATDQVHNPARFGAEGTRTAGDRQQGNRGAGNARAVRPTMNGLSPDDVVRPSCPIQ
jgi:hypothetical protein